MKKAVDSIQTTAAQDLAAKVAGTYATVLADPPWRFQNRTGKMAPEHQRLLRYPTMTLEDVCALPVKPFLPQRASVPVGSQRPAGRGAGSHALLGLQL